MSTTHPERTWTGPGAPERLAILRRARSIAAGDTRAERPMIGIEPRLLSERMVSANSNPFMSGISMSVRTTSKLCARSAARPSCAVGAVRTR